jgi:hypothetical protein
VSQEETTKETQTDQSPSTPVQTPESQLPPVVQEIVAQAAEQQAETTTISNGEEANIEKAPENVTPISEAKKPSKFEMKRQQIFMDRMKRKMNEVGKDGKKKTQQVAMAEIAQEDYAKMPLDKKIQRLESMVAGMGRQVSMDITNLRRNDGAVADAFDMNYRGIAKMFEHLGIDRETQRKFMSEAEEEFEAERNKKIEAHAAEAAKKMAEAKAVDEQDRMEAEAAKKPAESAEEAKSEADPHVEQGATVFGG